MNRVKRAATALVISVAVYLTPTVGPHAVFVLGEVVWRDLGNILHGGRDHDLAWAATDIGVALMALPGLVQSLLTGQARHVHA